MRQEEEECWVLYSQCEAVRCCRGCSASCDAGDVESLNVNVPWIGLVVDDLCSLSVWLFLQAPPLTASPYPYFATPAHLHISALLRISALLTSCHRAQSLFSVTQD